MAKPYVNRQIGWMWLAGFVVLLIATVAILSASGVWWAGPLLIVPGFAIYGSFAVLTTRVERGEVRVSFAAGWPGRTIPVSTIAEHRVVRTKWWHGWGIRKVPGGWLYNVWGLDAVEIHYRDAKKGEDRMLRAGTNDPEGFADAITAARANRS